MFARQLGIRLKISMLLVCQVSCLYVIMYYLWLMSGFHEVHDYDSLEQRLSIEVAQTPWKCKKGLLGVQTFLPNCSLIYVTSDHNADVTNQGVFVSFMLHEQLTVK